MSSFDESSLIKSPLSQYFDHTILKADSPVEAVETLCHEAKTHNFASVCVNSSFVPLASKLLADTPSVKVCAVVGFPLGAMATVAKVFEAGWCCDNGASEIDMVINIGLLKSRHNDEFAEDIKAVVDVCHAKGAICKVILETCLLDAEEKRIASELALQVSSSHASHAFSSICMN